ncbi:MAG: hypothetical protein KDC52_17050, partial [Ignavibacteriae bacterium]|nr:hypothetical protein [Ignavibacteriota bacterium]
MLLISFTLANSKGISTSNSISELVWLAQTKTLDCKKIADIFYLGDKNICDIYAVGLSQDYDSFIDAIINKYEQIEAFRAAIETYYKNEGKKYQILKNVISSLKRVKVSKTDLSNELRDELKNNLCNGGNNFTNSEINQFKKSVCNNTYKVIDNEYLNKQLSIVEQQLLEQLKEIDKSKLFPEFSCVIENNSYVIGCTDDYINKLKIRYENTRQIIHSIASGFENEQYNLSECKVEQDWQKFDLEVECLDEIKTTWKTLESEKKAKLVERVLVIIFSNFNPQNINNSLFELVAQTKGLCRVNQGSVSLDCSNAFGWLKDLEQTVNLSDFNNIEDSIKENLFNKITNLLKPITITNITNIQGCIIAYPEIKEDILSWDIYYKELLNNDFCNDWILGNHAVSMGLKLIVETDTLPFENSALNRQVSVKFNNIEFINWLKKTQLKQIPQQISQTLARIENITITENKINFQPFKNLNFQIFIDIQNGNISTNYQNCNNISDCDIIQKQLKRLLDDNIISLIPPPFCIKEGLKL